MGRFSRKKRGKRNPKGCQDTFQMVGKLLIYSRKNLQAVREHDPQFHREQPGTFRDSPNGRLRDPVSSVISPVPRGVKAPVEERNKEWSAFNPGGALGPSSLSDLKNDFSGSILLRALAAHTKSVLFSVA